MSKPTGNPPGAPRAPYVDELTQRRRARQRAYYYAKREERLAYAREYYLKTKPQLSDEEQRERDRIADQRKAAAAERKKQRNIERQATRAKRQRRWLNRLKLERGCVDCGYNDWPSALHFDHKPGEHKAFEIGAGVHYSWTTIMAEVAKCDVRCANCHHKITDLRRYGVGYQGPSEAAGKG